MRRYNGTLAPRPGPGSLDWTFRYQDDAIVEERLTDATHTDALVRSYVVDDTGTVVRMTIAAGEPDAGTYLAVWNGHGDAVNLSRLNTDGSLTLANSYRYETWGRPATATHNGIGDLGFRYLYVGEFDVQWDDQLGLGLLYMTARHYSPALGRFVQPDPDRSEANLYAYAANNPVTEMDPDGTCFIVCQLVVGALIDSGRHPPMASDAPSSHRRHRAVVPVPNRSLRRRSGVRSRHSPRSIHRVGRDAAAGGGGRPGCAPRRIGARRGRWR